MKMKTKHQNSGDTVKALHREKFITLNEYTRNEESSKINYLSFQLRKLEKNKKLSPK